MAELPGRLEVTGGGDERRRAPRILRAIDLQFRICTLPDEKAILEALDKLLVAQSHDLSETGICMWTNRMLVPASVIELEFPAAGGVAGFSVRARVVWCQPVTEGGYTRCRTGLEFIELTPEIRSRLLSTIRSQ